VEGDDIFKGTVDVVVCDGFVGNVALKTSEGLAKLMADQNCAVNSRKTCITQSGRIIALPVLRAFKRKLDPRRYQRRQSAGAQRRDHQKSRLRRCLSPSNRPSCKAIDEVRGGLLRRIAEQVGIHATAPAKRLASATGEPA
jgi:glycerol-3-phosphate acyltransferase PlsX